jgi:5-carboxymethyl-2-hydroxymuconate isomerase
MLSNIGSTAMPHFRIEYSENLLTKVDMAEFCADIHKAILKTGLFEVGAVRVRGFLDMQFAVGQGRSADDLKKAGDDIFKTASEHLAQLFQTPHFALSFSITEINGNLSWKHNAMHARLRNT